MKHAIMLACLWCAACSGDSGGSKEDTGSNEPTDSRDGNGSNPGDGPDEQESTHSLPSLDATLPPFRAAEPQRLIRVELQRADGKVNAAPLRVITSRQLPLLAFSPEVMLAAYAGERVVNAVPVRFLTRRSATLYDGERAVHTTTQIAGTHATAFLPYDAAIDRVVLLNADGKATELHRGPLPEPEADADEAPRLRAQDLGTRTQALRLFDYPTIELIEEDESDRVSAEDLTYKDEATGELSTGMVATTTSENLDLLRAALAKVPPALLSAITAVVFIRWPMNSKAQGDLYAFTSGSRLFINVLVPRASLFNQVIVHESAHAFENLTERVAGQSGSNMWPREVIDAAALAMAPYRLAGGLSNVWADIHASGVTAKLAGKYIGKGASEPSHQDAIRQGFASGYGALDVSEDLAEFVATTIVPAPKNPGMCELFKGRNEIAPEVAIPYAKLVLLRGVDAIPAADFDRCIGAVKIPSERGVHFQNAISFEGKSRSLFDSGENGPFYELLAEGDNSYIFDMQLSLRRTRPDDAAVHHSALGLHRLRPTTNLLFQPGPLDSIFIYHNDPFKARTSKGGLVLITDDSAEHAEGILMGVPFESPTGVITDEIVFGSWKY